MSGSSKSVPQIIDVIKDLDERLKSGEADKAFQAGEGAIKDTVAKLREAEQLDPATLKLTVTI